MSEDKSEGREINMQGQDPPPPPKQNKKKHEPPLTAFYMCFALIMFMPDHIIVHGPNFHRHLLFRQGWHCCQHYRSGQ